LLDSISTTIQECGDFSPETASIVVAARVLTRLRGYSQSSLDSLYQRVSLIAQDRLAEFRGLIRLSV
jgi:hypothetical protein